MLKSRALDQIQAKTFVKPVLLERIIQIFNKKCVGFLAIYLIEIYEDIFSRRSGRSGVISLLVFYITQLYSIIFNPIISPIEALRIYR